MDALTYQYAAGTNQLNHVRDDYVWSADYTEDIDNQNPKNYRYDKIGNMIRDVAGGLGTTSSDGVSWTVYGKIASITKIKNSITTNISYTYDASGNRVSKKVDNKTIVYVQDAQGNVMSIYEN